MILIGTTIPGKSECKSNGNEGDTPEFQNWSLIIEWNLVSYPKQEYLSLKPTTTGFVGWQWIKITQEKKNG